MTASVDKNKGFKNKGSGYGLLFMGGRLRGLSMFSDKYGDKDLADDVVQVVLQQARDAETELIKGFLLEPTENQIDIHKADYVISEIKDEIEGAI